MDRPKICNLENEVRLYKAILKPVWTYGRQLWGTASNSNIEIIQRYQSKILRQIVNAPFYTSNASIHKDLGIPDVKEEIAKHIKKYIDRLRTHNNNLSLSLVNNNNNIRRLKRCHVLDLPDRF